MHAKETPTKLNTTAVAAVVQNKNLLLATKRNLSK
jgi:hypothetical protein